ncbi:MAG: PleD family two-component system response regulator [Leptolyngbyaceae cyanobacterium]
MPVTGITTGNISYTFFIRNGISGFSAMTGSPTGKRYVLAVDDSPVMQKLIQDALKGDYCVLVTGSPVDVLKLIYSKPVSVVLLDVMMPDIDGLELCRTLRTIPQFQALPIIMITSKDTPFDKVQGRMAGASAYITKPFKAEHLRQVVQQLIEVETTTP